MAKLVTACFRDEERAIRPSDYERTRDPTPETMEAVDMALDRPCHDRGAV